MVWLPLRQSPFCSQSTVPYDIRLSCCCCCCCCFVAVVDVHISSSSFYSSRTLHFSRRYTFLFIFYILLCMCSMRCEVVLFLLIWISVLCALLHQNTVKSDVDFNGNDKRWRQLHENGENLWDMDTRVESSFRYLYNWFEWLFHFMPTKQAREKPFHQKTKTKWRKNILTATVQQQHFTGDERAFIRHSVCARCAMYVYTFVQQSRVE